MGCLMPCVPALSHPFFVDEYSFFCQALWEKAMMPVPSEVISKVFKACPNATVTQRMIIFDRQYLYYIHRCKLYAVTYHNLENAVLLVFIDYGTYDQYLYTGPIVIIYTLILPTWYRFSTRVLAVIVDLPFPSGNHREANTPPPCSSEEVIP